MSLPHKKSKIHLIFHSATAQRFLQERKGEILPRYLSPGVFRYMWGILFFLLLVSIGVWFTQIPVYVSGSAVVAETITQTGEGGITLVVFLPPASLSDLHVGQTILVHETSAGKRREGTLTSVESEVIPAEVARKQLGLTADAASTGNKLVAIAIASVDPLPDRQTAVPLAGKNYRVDIEVGARRLISMFPYMDLLPTTTGKE